MDNVYCIYCSESIGDDETQVRFAGLLEMGGAFGAQCYYEVHGAFCVLATVKMEELETGQEVCRVVEEVYCEIDKVYEWSMTASDFVCDLHRVLERSDGLELSRKQVLYLCKLHMIFCENGIGRSSEIEAQYRRLVELEE